MNGEYGLVYTENLTKPESFLYENLLIVQVSLKRDKYILCKDISHYIFNDITFIIQDSAVFLEKVPG